MRCVLRGYAIHRCANDGGDMKRYRGVVVFRYYQEIEVEAETQDDAERIMCEEFRLDKADGESEVYDMEEVK
jgi:hypothetical protein